MKIASVTDMFGLFHLFQTSYRLLINTISLTCCGSDFIEELIVFAREHDAWQLLADCSYRLGKIRHVQQHHHEALILYDQALRHYAALFQPDAVINTWNQIGTIYRKIEQFERAEYAYRQSIMISVQQGYKNQSQPLDELGTLYEAMGRPEEL